MMETLVQGEKPPFACKNEKEREKNYFLYTGYIFPVTQGYNMHTRCIFPVTQGYNMHTRCIIPATQGYKF